MWLLIVFLGSLFLLFYLSLRKRKAAALDYDEKLELALSTFPMVGLWTLGIIAISLLLEAGSSLLPGYFDELTTTLLLSEISVIF